MRWMLMAAVLTLFACQGTSGTGSIETERFALAELEDITLEEGQQLLVKLVVLNAGKHPVTFTADNLPPFASLSGNTFTLAPGPGSEGETVVTVRASTGEAQDSKQFTVRVLRPGGGDSQKPPEPCNTPMEPVVSWSVSGGRTWKRLASNTCEELYGHLGQLRHGRVGGGRQGDHHPVEREHVDAGGQRHQQGSHGRQGHGAG